MKKETVFQTKLKQKIKEDIEQLQNEGEKFEGFSIKFQNNERKIKWKPKEHFIKMYSYELAYVVRELNLDSYELSTILLLLPYVEYETNLLSFENGMAINKKDIINILKFSENKVDGIIDSLVTKKILSKTKVGRSMIYHINPSLVFRGTYVSPETESIFRNQVICEL